MIPDKYRECPGLSWEDVHNLAAMCANSNRSLSNRLFVSASLIANSEYQRIHSESGLAVNLMNDRVDVDWCIECLREKAASDPGDFHNWLNLGTAYIKKPDLEQAGEALVVAHRLNDKSPEVWAMLAALADLSGDNENQLEAVKAAAAGSDTFKCNYAMALAKKPDVDWEEFSRLYHFREKPFNSNREAVMRLPYMDKEAWPDLTVYVVYEQGIGDFIMMAPLITWLSGKVGRVVFCSDKKDINELAELVPGIAEARMTPFNINKGNDIVINLMDLMYHFGRRYDIVKDKPSFSVDKLDNNGIDIGLNFTGNPKFWFEYARGIYDEAAITKIKDRFRGRSVDLTAGSGSLVDLAKRIAGLRLVITTDTMVAHLAGALHVPCITMLSVNRDWRWYHDLYPMTKTVVQRELMKWDEVVEKAIEMAEEILCES